MATPEPMQVASPTGPQTAPSAAREAPLMLTEAQKIDSANTVTTNSFIWLASAANESVNALRAELAETDEPFWAGALAMAALELAIGAGAAAVGEKIASGLVLPVAGEVNEVRKEFVKAIFEEGTGEGVRRGGELLKGEPNDVRSAFIAAQRDGAKYTHMNSQTHFITDGRYRITTVAAAETLSNACSQEKVEAAGALHHDVARNAWLSYMSRQKFGSNNGRTNLTDASHRAASNAHAPGFEPPEPPSQYMAFMSEAPGVLVMQVRLPGIFLNAMSGPPVVERAFLNGVNKKIGAQFEGKPLATAAIARVIDAVAADGTVFQLRVDEDNALVGPAGHAANEWLHSRAIVGHPENTDLGYHERVVVGFRALLEDIVPSEILC